ncbi:MAG: preprotein translocase subunit YajC [Flavobacteriales bacterium]|nr:preprotein translocase subunit YajC [Flavobacteriales bacterium]
MEQLQQFAPFLLMFVVIYFFMIRPQSKKQKQEKAFEESLKPGMRIVTRSGLHAKVVEVNEKTIVVETMAGKLLFDKTAVSLELSQALNEKEKK